MNYSKFQPLWLLLALGCAFSSTINITSVAYAQADDDVRADDDDVPSKISAVDMLIEAASEGDISTVQRSLRAGVSINAQDENGFTALMVAAGSGEAEMVRFLLAKGAHRALKDARGYTALQYAQESKNAAIVAMVRGAKVPAPARKNAVIELKQNRPSVPRKQPGKTKAPVTTKKAVSPAPTRSLPASRAIEGGLYFRIQSHFIGTSLSITQEHFAFWPDGRLYKGVPTGGLERFNFAAARRANPSACGSYTIAGSKITFHMANGKRETHDFKRAAGGFDLDGIFTSRQRSFKPNQRLVGLYDGGASVGGGSNGSYVASVKSLRFMSDGTFEGSTIGAVSANTTAGTVSGKSEKADAGSYALSGNTLVLRHKSGPVTYHTVYPYDLGGGKTAINIDGVMLHRRQ